MQAKQEAEAWVKSLKPGDKIIKVETGWCGNEDTPMAVLTVKKVTATGIVRTVEGQSFQQKRYTNNAYVGEYGGTDGAIVPYDDGLAEKAEAYQQNKKAAENNRLIIRDAKNICWDIAYSRKPLSLSLAKKILKEYKEE